MLLGLSWLDLFSLLFLCTTWLIFCNKFIAKLTAIIMNFWCKGIRENNSIEAFVLELGIRNLQAVMKVWFVQLLGDLLKPPLLIYTLCLNTNIFMMPPFGLQLQTLPNQHSGPPFSKWFLSSKLILSTKSLKGKFLSGVLLCVLIGLRFMINSLFSVLDTNILLLLKIFGSRDRKSRTIISFALSFSSL